MRISNLKLFILIGSCPILFRVPLLRYPFFRTNISKVKRKSQYYKPLSNVDVVSLSSILTFLKIGTRHMFSWNRFLCYWMKADTLLLTHALNDVAKML